MGQILLAPLQRVKNGPDYSERGTFGIERTESRLKFNLELMKVFSTKCLSNLLNLGIDS